MAKALMPKFTLSWLNVILSESLITHYAYRIFRQL